MHNVNSCIVGDPLFVNAVTNGFALRRHRRRRSGGRVDPVFIDRRQVRRFLGLPAGPDPISGTSRIR